MQPSTYGQRAFLRGASAQVGVVGGYQLDSGCIGRNVMGKSVLDQLKAVSPVDLQYLDPPVFLQNPWNSRAPCTLLATLTVVLETRLGPCVFDKVEFLVCDLPIQALYFGTSFQRKLGLPD